MARDRIHFNCGEFLPGKEPINLGGIPPPNSGVYIPGGTGDPDPPSIPGRRSEWVCVCHTPCNSSNGYLGDGRKLCISENARSCVEKWTVAPGLDMSVKSYPTEAACLDDAFNHEPCLICGVKCTSEEPTICPPPYVGYYIRRQCVTCTPAAFQPAECLYRSHLVCAANCRDTNCARQPPQGPYTGPGDVITPASPTTYPTGVGGPTTGGNTIRYRCSETIVYCPNDFNLPVNERRVQEVIRNCSLCSPLADGSWPSDCIFSTRDQCTAICANSYNPNNCVDIISQQQGTSQEPNQNTGIVNPDSGISINVINVNEVAQKSIVAYTETPDQSPQIYNNVYNFFSNEQLGTDYNYTSNFIRLDIFKTEVVSQVGNALNLVSSISPWNEDNIFTLTDDMIKLSIREELDSAFNSIHSFGGQLVDSGYFYRGLKKSILTGRISEYDPQYYISLAQNQRNDEFIQYNGGDILEYNERLALGIIANEGVIADPSQYDTYNSNQLKRQRRLLTDIEASVSTKEFLLDTFESLYLSDLGLSAVDIDNNVHIVEIGDGDGYYISAMDEPGNQIPLLLDTLEGKAVYVPPGARENALDLFGEENGILLEVSSLDGYGEFAENYDYTTISGPLYFILDLSTISDDTRDNPLVDNITARYVLETDEGVIRQHSINNGLAISKVNIDYRDPFYCYCRDSGVLTLSQKDITFRSFKQNRTSVGDNIITRNIPFGLIITPGCGSKHNPLNGESKLKEYKSNVVVRNILVYPDIGRNDSSKNYSFMEEKNLYEELGTYKVGLAEENHAQNVIYLYSPSSQAFSDLYYYNQTYNANPPDSIERHPLSNFILSTVDKVINTYDPSSLTWWDIIRRLSFNQYASIGYNSSGVFNYLESGWRSGVPVRSVLSRLENDYTGLNGLDSDDIDIKINESDRIRSEN